MKGRITMKKVICIALVVVSLLGLMIPAFASASAAPGESKWVNCSDGKRLNLRTQPNGRLICRLDNGTEVQILSNLHNGWVEVYSYSVRKTGYVKEEFLVNSKPGKYEITERADNFVSVNPYYVIAKPRNSKTTESVCLRVKPNKQSASLRRLAEGDMLQVIAVGKTWMKVIDLQTGRTGYVASDYMTNA
jgi:hypothetical protein